MATVVQITPHDTVPVIYNGQEVGRRQRYKMTLACGHSVISLRQPPHPRAGIPCDVCPRIGQIMGAR